MLIEETDIKQIEKDFKTLIIQPPFRRVLYWLLEQTQPLVSHFDANPNLTAYMQGKSDLGKQLMGLLLKDHPEKYKQMIDERKSVLEMRKKMKEGEKENDN
jgi:hypothetical protein